MNANFKLLLMGPDINYTLLHRVNIKLTKNKTISDFNSFHIYLLVKDVIIICCLLVSFVVLFGK